MFRASASIKFWAGALVLSSADHGHAAALICSCSFPTTTFFVTAFWKKAGQQSRKRPTTIFSWHFIPIGKCAESRRVIIAQGHKSSFVIFKIVWFHLLCPKNAAAFHGQPAAKAMVPFHSSWPGAITIIFFQLILLETLRILTNRTANKKHSSFSIHLYHNRCAFGRGRRIRTLGTRFWRPLLYQLSYAPM